MSERKKTRLIKYGSCALIVCLMASLYIYSRYTSDWNTRFADRIGELPTWWSRVAFWFQCPGVPGAVAWFQWICDGLTLPSVSLLSAGLLIWVSNAGALDALGYAGRFVMQMFLPAGKKRYGTYGDYVLERREKRIRGYGFLLISGAVSLGITLLMLALYYTAQ